MSIFNEQELTATEIEVLKWKIELADAIISESVFNGMALEPGTDTIDHQLGTVWVGNVTITMMEAERGVTMKFINYYKCDNGTSGQDRESYTDDQDRNSYTINEDE